MKTLLSIGTILLLSMTTLFAQETKSIYQMSWCGKSGHLKKAQIDSLLQSGCTKLTTTPNEKGVQIQEYSFSITPKGMDKPSASENELPGGMFFPSVKAKIKNAKPGDKFKFTGIKVRKNGDPIYIEKNILEITIE